MEMPQPLAPLGHTRAQIRATYHGGHVVLIPEADGKDTFGITAGWYNAVDLLRYHKTNPDAVQFIADMME